MLPGQDYPLVQMGPLPSGIPEEVGKGCSRHVVVLWPQLSPLPSYTQSWTHTRGQLTVPSAHTNVAVLLDRIAVVLGLCKSASLEAPMGWTVLSSVLAPMGHDLAFELEH